MSQKRRRILCVDGNKDVCEILKLSIQQEGYETKIANTIGEAADLIHGETFDVYVVEKTFNDGSWREFLNLVRAHSPNSRFILFSSDPYEPTLAEAIAAGVDAHLVSDGNIHPLVGAIRELLAR